MDWNIFFSSLVQCTAAIVGILGAFMISKIISREEEYYRIDENLDRLLMDINKQKEVNENLHITWYNDISTEFIRNQNVYYKLTHKLEYSEKNAEDVIREFMFSPFQPVNTVKKIVKKDLKEKISKNISGEEFPDAELIVLYNRERDNILSELANSNSLAAQSVHLLNQTKQFTMIRNAYNVIIVANIFLFLIGVIYPLSLLPLPAGETGNIMLFDFTGLKTVLLGIISLVYLFVSVYFFIKNRKLVIDGNKTNELHKHLLIDNYLQAFKFYRQNIDSKLFSK